MAEYRDPPDDDGELTAANLTPEIVRAISEPVGFILLNWGMIEQALVAQIEATAHLRAAAGLTIKRQGATSDRLKMMRNLLQNAPELSRYKEPATALLEKAAAFQTLRHMFVHGSLQAYLPEEGLFVFNRLQPTADKDGHFISQEAVKTSDLQNALNTIAEVRRSMMVLASSLMRDFGRD